MNFIIDLLRQVGQREKFEVRRKVEDLTGATHWANWMKAIALMVMHVVAWAITVMMLTRLTRA